MATLAEIRAKLQQNETRQQNKSAGGDTAIYRHWDIPEGATAKLRFLPDGDPKNDFFWIERAMIKLPFAGIKGQADSRPTMIQVPCVEMWGESCPILAEVRPMYKDSTLTETANKYWKKRTYLFQGFVRDNPLKEENPPENIIRRFIISPQIFTIIKSALMDSEIEEIPTHYERGLDFNIIKTSTGNGQASYTTSKWARKESALTNVERAAIDSYGLFNLKEFLPKKPTDVELKVMVEMFEASIDGQAYDLDRWGQYFKPPGFGSNREDRSNNNSGSTSTRPAPAAKVADDVDDDSVPFDTDTPTVASAPVVAPKPASTNTKAEDILAMIRSRQK